MDRPAKVRGNLRTVAAVGCRMRRSLGIAPAFFFGLAVFAAQPASPAGFVADAGCKGDICMTGFGLAIPGRPAMWQGSTWRVDQYWKPRVAVWHASNAPLLWEVGLMPTFRFSSGGGFFAEAAIGAHVLSRTRIGPRQLGTAFQFGEQAAAGFTFGRKNEVSLAVRAEHVSNGGIRQPNDGITMFGLELQVGMP